MIGSCFSKQSIDNKLNVLCVLIEDVGVYLK